MPDSAMHRTNAKQLAALLAVGREEPPVWTDAELAAMLTHQLAAPLEVDLGGIALVAGAGPAETPGVPRTFGELLTHAQPPLEVLRLVKQFAKQQAEHPASALPEPIGRALYLAAIIAARVRCGARISELDDATLAQALDWALERRWMDATVRGLFESGRAELGEG